jgi:hypothetical protein
VHIGRRGRRKSDFVGVDAEALRHRFAQGERDRQCNLARAAIVELDLAEIGPDLVTQHQVARDGIGREFGRTAAG